MDTLLTTEKVADVFGVTPGTIRLWALQGLIKGFRMGKRWYFQSNAIEHVMETNRR